VTPGGHLALGVGLLLALAAAGAATMLAPVRSETVAGRFAALPKPVGRSADVTDTLADLFPAGTPVAAAVARLGEEGFACGADPGQPGLTRCWRRTVDFPCENTWVVYLAANGSALVRMRAMAAGTCD
jgi:hypothetical protein